MYIYIYIYAYVISRSGSGKGDPTYSRRVPEGPGGGFSDLSVDPRRKRKREERKTSLVICTSSFSSWEIFGKSKVRVKGKGGGGLIAKEELELGGNKPPWKPKPTQSHHSSKNHGVIMEFQKSSISGTPLLFFPPSI